jgi:hypothetical protein
MGFDPSMFLLQYRIKLVTQKLRIEIMSISYHPLCLADVSIHVVAVRQGLAAAGLLTVLHPPPRRRSPHRHPPREPPTPREPPPPREPSTPCEPPALRRAAP